jgi:ribonuclease J
MDEARHVVDTVVNTCQNRNITDKNKWKLMIKDGLGDYIWKKTKRRPMLVTVILDD